MLLTLSHLPIVPCPLCLRRSLRIRLFLRTLEQVKGYILSQVKGSFDSFAASLEACFKGIDSFISQVDSSRDLPVASVAQRSEHVSDRAMSGQDVLPNCSLTAPTVVAGRSDPAPDGVPSAPSTGGPGRTQEGRLPPGRLRALLPFPAFPSRICLSQLGYLRLVLVYLAPF